MRTQARQHAHQLVGQRAFPERKLEMNRRSQKLVSSRRQEKGSEETERGQERAATIVFSPKRACQFEHPQPYVREDASSPSVKAYNPWEAAGINNSVWFDDNPEKLKKRFVREEIASKIVAWGVSPSFGGVAGATEKLEKKPFDRRLEYHSFQKIAFMEFGGRPFALRPPLVEMSIRPTRSAGAVATRPSVPRAVATAGSLARTPLQTAPAPAGVGRAPSVVIDSAWGFAPRSAWGVKVVEAAKATAAKARSLATWINEGAGYLGGKHPLWPARNEAYVFELLKAGYQHIKDAFSRLFYAHGGDSFLWLSKSQRFYKE
ncbi:MAG: hypothetical protein QXG98_02925 [Candidatus Micrarchaeia archaeon]